MPVCLTLEEPSLDLSLYAMAAVTLKAHFDGEQIRLDEPFELPKNCSLMVTVLPGEIGDWVETAKAGLARAYGKDEPEYSVDDVKHD